MSHDGTVSDVNEINWLMISVHGLLMFGRRTQVPPPELGRVV
jgi:hypothetical protein